MAGCASDLPSSELKNQSFSSEEALYAEAKYYLLCTTHNQYLIYIIVVVSFAWYSGVPAFEIYCYCFRIFEEWIQLFLSHMA